MCARSPSEIRRYQNAQGSRLAGGEIVVAIRRRPVALVKDILDVELRLPGLADPREHCTVEPDEARQPDRVIGRRKRVREIDDSDRRRPYRSELILVPPGELVERYELHAIAGDDRSRCI